MSQRRLLPLLAWLLVLATTSAARVSGMCAGYATGQREDALVGVSTWMYQIQELNEAEQISKLEASDYDMLVVEPTYTYDSSFDVARLVERLRCKPDGSPRLVIAYIDIGQAEEYRYYWQDDWVAPTSTSRGTPDWIVARDGDGWAENHAVAYWHADWKDIWLGNAGQIADLARLGFDGIYLDWIEAYDFEPVIEVAEEEDVDAPAEMRQFVAEMRQAGRAVASDFLVIAQNAPYLSTDVGEEHYYEVIDALAVEGTWFTGQGDAPWDAPDAGDRANPYEDDYTTEALVEQFQQYRQAGLPVLSVDYVISADNADFVYHESRCNQGFIPLATRISLSRMTETPEPGNTCSPCLLGVICMTSAMPFYVGIAAAAAIVTLSAVSHAVHRGLSTKPMVITTARPSDEPRNRIQQRGRVVAVR